MTAFATILALIPLAAGFNQGSIIASEFGTVVIGGLFSSTLLTLIVVPVIYSLVDGLRDRIERVAGAGGVDEHGGRGDARLTHDHSPGGRPRERPWQPLGPPGPPGPSCVLIAQSHSFAPKEVSRWPSPASPKPAGRAACSQGSGTIDYVSSGAFTRLARDLGRRGPRSTTGRASPGGPIARRRTQPCFSMAFSARLAKNNTPAAKLSVQGRGSRSTRVTPAGRSRAATSRCAATSRESTRRSSRARGGRPGQLPSIGRPEGQRRAGGRRAARLTRSVPRQPDGRAVLPAGILRGCTTRGSSSTPPRWRPGPALLEPVRESGGLVVEFGCGSGLLTRELIAAGHRVIATDASPAMLDLAREMAPGAVGYQVLALPGDPLPPADAIVGVGHPINYLPSLEAIHAGPGRHGRCAAARRDARVRRLRPRYGARRGTTLSRGWVADDWALVTQFSVPAPDRFVRQMAIFTRNEDGTWRRDDERHDNVLAGCRHDPAAAPRTASRRRSARPSARRRCPRGSTRWSGARPADPATALGPRTAHRCSTLATRPGTAARPACTAPVPPAICAPSGPFAGCGSLRPPFCTPGERSSGSTAAVNSWRAAGAGERPRAARLEQRASRGAGDQPGGKPRSRAAPTRSSGSASGSRSSSGRSRRPTPRLTQARQERPLQVRVAVALVASELAVVAHVLAQQDPVAVAAMEQLEQQVDDPALPVALGGRERHAEEVELDRCARPISDR